MLKLYNTLTRKKENFKPLNEKQAGIYTCGPTVYNFAHIGNLRSYVFADILQRVLKFNGYKINWVMNITDVDDKTISGARNKYSELSPKEALLKFTKEYEKIFWQDLAKLNVEKPNKIPHATEFVPQMQDLIIKIMESGYGYEKDGSFYFDVKKYSRDYKYGQLVKLDLSQLKTGARALSDEYEKEEIQDFVLWKDAKQGEPSWDFKYQGKNYPGRPGWHIECSAMSHKYLNTPFDIHTGGVDLKFPHHENEIAQSTTGYNTNKLVNFFLHNEHVLVDNKRMGKRFKNFYTIKDLEEKNINPLAYRYFCLNARHRSKLNFTWQGLEAAQNALENLYNTILDWNDSRKAVISNKNDDGTTITPSRASLQNNYRQQFADAINDDLNTPQSLAVMWKAIKDKSLANIEKKNLLLDFDKIFGLKLSELKPIEIPETIKKLAEQRKKLRQQKKWREADEMRKKIEDLGFKIEDVKGRVKIKRT